MLCNINKYLHQEYSNLLLYTTTLPWLASCYCELFAHVKAYKMYLTFQEVNTTIFLLYQ